MLFWWGLPLNLSLWHSYRSLETVNFTFATLCRWLSVANFTFVLQVSLWRLCAHHECVAVAFELFAVTFLTFLGVS